MAALIGALAFVSLIGYALSGTPVPAECEHKRRAARRARVRELRHYISGGN